MARTRSLKPAFFTSEQVASCTPLARILFAGLWTLADRAGKLQDRPRRIRAELFPYEADQDAEGWLQELREAGLIVRYEVAGERYIRIPGFEKHQNPHPREPKSEIPDPEVEPSIYAASRVKALPGPAGSSHSPFPIPLADPVAVDGPGTGAAQGPAVWEIFRDNLADRMAVPRDWLRVASPDRTAEVRAQLDAEVTRLGLPRAVEVAAEAATRAKTKPRWLAYFIGALQDASRLSASQDAWQDGPRSEVWRDEQGRTLDELRRLFPDTDGVPPTTATGGTP